MEFRWVAAITLWTMLSGPVFVEISTWKPFSRTAVSSVRASKPVAPLAQNLRSR